MEERIWEKGLWGRKAKFSHTHPIVPVVRGEFRHYCCCPKNICSPHAYFCAEFFPLAFLGNSCAASQSNYQGIRDIKSRINEIGRFPTPKYIFAKKGADDHPCLGDNDSAPQKTCLSSTQIYLILNYPLPTWMQQTVHFSPFFFVATPPLHSRSFPAQKKSCIINASNVSAARRQQLQGF